MNDYSPISPSAGNVLWALEQHTGQQLWNPCTLELANEMRANLRGPGSGSIPKRICDLKAAGYPVTAVGWHRHGGTRYRTYRLEEQ